MAKIGQNCIIAKNGSPILYHGKEWAKDDAKNGREKTGHNGPDWSFKLHYAKQKEKKLTFYKAL